MSDTDQIPTADLRLLVLMRHGEAQGHSATGDEGRELTPRGREDATWMGQWLVGQGVRPDVVVVSSSIRTRQTWDALERGGVEASDVRVDEAVYNGTTDDIVEAVRAVPEDVRVVLVVGHAPAVPDLATGVEIHCERPRSWSPGTLGVLSHADAWEDFPGPDTALVAWHQP